MKRALYYLTIILMIIYPAYGFSSYLIELKKGTRFITNRYWEEDNQIRFYSSGGIIGIDKTLVKRITESDLPPYTESLVMPEKTEGDKAKKERERQDLEYYKDKKATLQKELEKTEAEFRKANLSGDLESKKIAKQRYNKLRKQLSALQKKLIQDNNGVLPDWWK